MVQEDWILNLEDNEWPLTTIDHDRMIARAIVVDDEGYFYFVRANRDDDFGKARHMYKKMGFKEYGMNPRAFKLKDGTYRDEIIMANIFE